MAQMGNDFFRFKPDHQDDLGDFILIEGVNLVVQNGFVAQSQETFRQPVSERAQTLGLPRRENNGFHIN